MLDLRGREIAMNDKLADFMIHFVIIGEKIIGIMWILISVPIAILLDLGSRLMSVLKR